MDPRMRLARIQCTTQAVLYEARADGSLLIGVNLGGWWRDFVIPADGGKAVPA